MKVKKYDRPQSEGSIPEGISKFLRTTFDQVELLSNAVRNRLGPENSNEEIREISVSDDTTETIYLQTLLGTPHTAFLGYSEHFSPAQFAWRIVDRNRVEVKVKWVSAPSSPVLCRFVFRGGPS